MLNLGLALSGGGSRAAAFHSGTLLAMEDMGLLNLVDVVSSVSGGSLLGAAWVAANSRSQGTREFVEEFRAELVDGFLRRSLGWPAVFAFVPFARFSRTDLLASTFDKTIFRGITLGELPESPALCLNTAVLNSGQVGKFSREGFSAWGISWDIEPPNHIVPWPDFPVALAVAASAAFPIGLPPLTIRVCDMPRGVKLVAPLAGNEICLTDGGVLENLGIQTLLKSRRFATWNSIISDAETHRPPWKDRGFANSLRGFVVWCLSGRVLDQLMQIMNDKQSRWARELAYGELFRSVLVEGGPLESKVAKRRRSMLFLRVATDWRSYFRSIPQWRLVELGNSVGIRAPVTDDHDCICDFLADVGCELTKARENYARLGGDEGAREMNLVKTGFHGLSRDIVTRLGYHAAWQLHAGHAVYWPSAQGEVRCE